MVRRAALGLCLAIAGCGPSTGVALLPIAPRTAVVGVELAITVRATDGDAELSYSADLADLATRRLHPSLTPYAGGVSIFRWTPLGGDLGQHELRFTATLGGVSATARVPVTVVGGADPIVFREPVGEGTTLDLMRASCATVSILVDDPDAAQVTLAAGGAWPDNATLAQDGPLSGTLHFCPTSDQALAATIYPLAIDATDENQQSAEKRYTIVLGTIARPSPSPSPSPSPQPCDTTGPTLVHTPHKDITTAGNLHLSATVSDADGVAGATVYWSTSAPADPTRPDPAAMTALPMLFVGGTQTMSSFAATIPNPVLSDPVGTTATIYYFISATDEDDRVAGCTAHTAVSPAAGVYSFVVKRAL
jgi:hypothetical protein